MIELSRINVEKSVLPVGLRAGAATLGVEYGIIDTKFLPAIAVSAIQLAALSLFLRSEDTKDDFV